MSAPHGDDLERRLAELFQQRAATVKQGPRVDLGSDDSDRKATSTRPHRFGTPRENLALLAAAAVVLVALAGTVVGIREFHQWQVGSTAGVAYGPSLKPSASVAVPSTSCVATAPTSWRQAIDAGAYPVDKSLNAVISANGGTRDYLAVQGNEPADRSSQIYADLEVALFQGSKGKTIYTGEDDKEFPQANPIGAISAEWVTFAVAYPHNLGYHYKVMLYERRTGGLRTLAGGPEQQDPGRKTVRRAPVIAAGKVYWLAAVNDKPETTTLESWDLSRRAAAGSVQAPHAIDLLPYGSGVATIHTVDSAEPGPGAGATLRNGAGAPLTQFQLNAVKGGGNFGFDGVRTLSWLRYDGLSVGYSSLVLGGAGVNHEPLIRQLPDSSAEYVVGFGPAIYPFTGAQVRGSDGLLDRRTGAAVALPAGYILLAVVGGDVVFGTGSHVTGAATGASGLSIVSLSDLPPVSC